MAFHQAISRFSVLLWVAAVLGCNVGAAAATSSRPPAFFHQPIPTDAESLHLVLPAASVHVTSSVDGHGLQAEVSVSCHGSLLVQSCQRAAEGLRWEASRNGTDFRWRLQAGPSSQAPKHFAFGRSKKGWAEIQVRVYLPASRPIRIEMAGSGALSINAPHIDLVADAEEGTIDYRVDRSRLGSLRIEASQWALPGHARRKAKQPVLLAGDGGAKVSLEAKIVRLRGDRPDRAVVSSEAVSSEVVSSETVSSEEPSPAGEPFSPLASAAWSNLIARFVRRRPSDGRPQSNRPVPRGTQPSPDRPPSRSGRYSGFPEDFELPAALERASNRDLVAGALHLGRWQREEAFFTLARMSFVLGEHHAVHRSAAFSYAAVLSRILFRLRDLEAETPPHEPPELVRLETALQKACGTPQKEPVAQAVTVAAVTSLYLIFRREVERANDERPWTRGKPTPSGTSPFSDLPSPNL